MEKVAVTGLGVISALGNNIQEFKTGLIEGKSGIKPITRFDASAYRNINAGVVEGDYGKDSISLEYAEDACSQAIKDSGLEIRDEDATRVGVAIASSLGCVGQFEKLILEKSNSEKSHISTFKNIPHSTIAHAISKKYGANGPCVSLDTACASGSSILGYAYDIIRKGQCDVVIAGGVDELSVLSYSGFSGMMNLSKELCKPFDKNRTGILLGEGCGMVVLESYSHAQKRNAHIYCTIAGYGLSNDAYHETQPDPKGEGAEKSIRMALKQAGISEKEVDYINAHGTGTKQNDAMEMKAINAIFGEYKENIIVSSIKGEIGHTLGAAGAIEFVATAIAMEEGFVPPTINFSEAMDEYKDWNYAANKSVSREIKCAVSDSFGFAGNCCAIVLRRD